MKGFNSKRTVRTVIRYWRLRLDNIRINQQPPLFAWQILSASTKRPFLMDLTAPQWWSEHPTALRIAKFLMKISYDKDPQDLALRSRTYSSVGSWYPPICSRNRCDVIQWLSMGLRKALWSHRSAVFIPQIGARDCTGWGGGGGGGSDRRVWAVHSRKIQWDALSGT